MDLMQLQYFKIIAETESLTRAAKILHVSQPAMSAMLKKMKSTLGDFGESISYEEKISILTEIMKEIIG